jgi:mono/diheme cytochrome c family protein
MKNLIQGAVCLLLAITVVLEYCVARAHEPPTPSPTRPPPREVPGFDLSNSQALERGRTLFLKNCAHCHGTDARGDEGPGLHGLKKSDEWIARRIRNGVKGEMTAFGEKFSDRDIADLTTFLRSLN